MNRYSSIRKPVTIVARHSRSGRANFGIGGVVGLVVVIALAAVRGFNSTPSWDTIDHDTIDIPLDQSFALEYQAPEEVRFRITAEEMSGKKLLVYWLDQKDYNSLQASEGDMALAQRMMSQTIGDASANVTGEVRLGPGTVNICFEAVDDVETTLTYTIEAWQ